MILLTITHGGLVAIAHDHVLAVYEGQVDDKGKRNVFVVVDHETFTVQQTMSEVLDLIIKECDKIKQLDP